MDSPEKRSDGIHSAQIDRASLKCLIDAAGDRNTLARRCGWMNLDKGRRRLQALVDGDLRHYEDFREALARGLGISAAQLDAVVDAQRHREARRAARDFVPHVVWRTAQSRPSGITLAVAFGFVSRLRFDPVDRTPLAMLRDAVARCPASFLSSGASPASSSTTGRTWPSTSTVGVIPCANCTAPPASAWSGGDRRPNAWCPGIGMSSKRRAGRGDRVSCRRAARHRCAPTSSASTCTTSLSARGCWTKK
ncbi:hypothetical protein [Pseudofulvimonas gallinarii]|uniref:hypothetical protein n=1 Tax=Pseudofulvimonas gallinarii TaxID=634155 RepID=UPI0035ECAB60